MRTSLALIGLGSALLLFACLAAPGDGSDSSSTALSCGGAERLFNGSCRRTCASTSECTDGTTCMAVGGDANLCLDFDHCAHLGSDTSCTRPAGYGYGYSSYGSYGDGTTCMGNGTWVVAPRSGDPACGKSHPVTRCAPVPGGCGLVAGTTVDIAEP